MDVKDSNLTQSDLLRAEMRCLAWVVEKLPEQLIENPDYKADMAMTFDLDVSEIKSNSVFITVNPNKMSYYYYGVVPAALYEKYQTSDEFLAAYVDAIKSKAQADANAYLTDYSLEPYLSKGYNSHEMTGLTPLTEYYLVAFDLSLSAAYSGNLSTLKFTSEKFPDSSGDFVITVDENANVVVDSLRSQKPSSLKGSYVKTVTVTTTMGPGLKVENPNL